MPQMNNTEFGRWLMEANRPPLVMGVLNVTPDSFSDGGRFSTHDAAIARAEQIASEGADLIDIGGESTRPGAEPVAALEQIRRIIPVLKSAAGRLPVVFSVDTTSSEVAEAALDAGASIVNDISAATFDSRMLHLVARRRLPIVLMHMQGNPATMQRAPSYSDVVAEVCGFLGERIGAAESAGIGAEKILVDPGIGFGKSMEHNLALLRRQTELLALKRPVVIGTSRKKFIGTITGTTDPTDRVFGTVATTAWAVANGAGIVRVHDVAANVQAVRMIGAIVGKSR
jgi:dihydropteroate synthase